MAGIALVSQYTGSGEKENANLVASQMLSLSIIFGMTIAVSGYISTPYLIPFITNASSLTETASTYMRLIFLGTPFMFISFTFQSILSAKGDTVTPMFVNFITVTFNIILDPFLIFGWYISPRLGVSGAAIATIISQGISAFISMYILFKGTRGVKITLKEFSLQKKWLGKILKIGLPSALGHSTAALGFVMLMAIIGRMKDPETVVAAYGIGDRLISIFLS